MYRNALFTFTVFRLLYTGGRTKMRTLNTVWFSFIDLQMYKNCNKLYILHFFSLFAE